MSTHELLFSDNGQARFGTGEDLKIYHDGSHSFIEDSGTGNLKILASVMEINNAADDEAIASFTADGAVELRHNNVKTFETTAEGAKVTGHLRLNNSQEMQFGGSATHIEGDSGYMAFDVNSVERVRIASNGNVAISGADGSYDTSAGHFNVKMSSAGTQMSMWNSHTNGNCILFHNTGGSAIGRIHNDASSTTYATSSDYRLKENVDYTWDATTRLKQLKPARFNFIVDDTNTLVDGFLAHEVSSVVPEAIVGEKDEVDDDDNAVYQGIDQSKLVPLLVKTIQELEARITALEG